MSKVIRDCIGFALLSTDWFRKVAKLSPPIKCKTNTNHNLVAFSRALGSLVVFAYSSHGLLRVFFRLLIEWCNNVGFGSTTLNRKALYV